MNLSSRLLRPFLSLALVALLGACATNSEPTPAPRKEIAYAVTAQYELIKFNTGDPRVILERKPIKGLTPGDRLLGLDFRVNRGLLYTVSHIGRVYTLDTTTAELKPTALGSLDTSGGAFGPDRTLAGYPLSGNFFGFDFNPVTDQIRLVSESGLNVRLNPDASAVVDGDPNTPGIQPDSKLAYVAGDVNFGRTPTLVGVAYSYNKQDPKLTTNYAIDRDLGSLVIQGSKEGETPVVSPNTGALRTVGALGLGTLRDASFDIAEGSGAAFVAVRTAEDARTRLHLVDLQTGRTRPLGTIGTGNPILGLAIAP